MYELYSLFGVPRTSTDDEIKQAFRSLAKRYHPDNQDSGDANKFSELVEAHTVLSDPEQRASYDVNYERVREARWKLFDQKSANSEIVTDTRVRLGILSLLYVARRNNVLEPGVGLMELERVLSVPDSTIQFQVWYLRENNWIERLATGMWAITAAGVDKLFDLGGPAKEGPYLLHQGETQEEQSPHRS